MSYYVVQINGYMAKAYNDEELEALSEARKAYYNEEPIRCRKALYGLYLLMKRHAPFNIVEVIDKNLAEVIRNDECTDI